MIGFFFLKGSLVTAFSIFIALVLTQVMGYWQKHTLSLEKRLQTKAASFTT